MTYIDPDVIDDETQVAEAILAAIADNITGWEPSEGSPETAMGEAMAIISATVASLLKIEERNNFRGFGERVLRLVRGAPGVATAPSTWTLTENPDGFTIPAGSEVVVESPISGEPLAFATTGDWFIAAGVLSAVGVVVTALEPGEDANGAVGAAVEFDDLTNGSASIDSVTLTSAASGGAEEEPLDEYVDRVADRARRVRAVPVTAADFAAFATDIPEVDRAVAINLLDPANPPAAGVAPSSIGHVTVIAIDAAGQPITGPALAALIASYATTDRPLGVEVHVIDATYVDLAIAVTVRLDPTVLDTAAVLAEVEDVVLTYLDPATYAFDDELPGRWRLPARDVDRPVRAYDVSNVVADVEGVAGVTAVTINGAASVDLTGWGALPNITGVVVTEAV